MTENSSKYKLAVIMPVKNEEKFIAQALDQLYLQDFPMDELEVVIADGQSTDKTREIAEQFSKRFGSFKLLDNPRMIASAGRNIGVRNSTAPYLLILDGHTYIPNKNFLSDILTVFESSQADCLCRSQPLTPPDINEFEKTVAMCRASALGHNPGSDIYSDYEGAVDPTSSGAMYRRDVFEKVGYFDESFDACEDVDFNHRVKLAGLKAYISPKLRVLYYPRSSVTGLWKQMSRYGSGRFSFGRKHQLVSLAMWLLAGLVVGFFLLMLLSLISTPVLHLFRSLLGVYLLIIIAFSGLLYLKENHFGCLLYGLLIFPAIHFGVGVGFLKGLWQEYRKVPKEEQS